MIRHPKSKLLRATCWLVVYCWFWLAMLFFGMLAALIFKWGWLSLVAMCGFFPGAVLYICAAFLFRCPACHRFVLVQTFRPLHPAARQIGGLAGWSAIVIDTLKHQRFTCMYCGVSCEVTPNA